MGEIWRLIEGAGQAAQNMALDVAMTWGVGEGLAPPTLRLYRWDPPAVSVGYAQRRDAALDLAACARAGLAVVRRPTGGRAVLHAGDVTYAVAVPRRGAWGSWGVAAACRRIHEAVAAGLSGLGVRAEVVGARPPLGGRRGEGGPLCFTSLSAHEIMAAGRKLVGSAQRRFRDAILQHGSIPLVAEHARLAALVARDPGSAGQRLEATMVSLGEVLGGPPDAKTVMAALARGFATTFRIQFAEQPWHPAELALAASLEAKLAAAGETCAIAAEPFPYLDTLWCV